MSFRPLVMVTALLSPLLVACDISDEGPTHTRENVFSYVSPLAAGSTLHLRTARGDIAIEPSKDDTLRVFGDYAWRGSSEPASGVTVTGRALPGAVLVCAEWGGRRSECSTENYHADLSGRAGKTRVNFRVQVPAGVKLDLLGIDTDIVSASSAPVVARSVNGDVTIVTSVGPVRAETLNGDVDARMTTLANADSVVVKTLNGEAWAFLPELVSASLDVQVSNGSLASDFGTLAIAAQATKHLQARLGTGATPVYVKSLNGRAGVRRLDASGRAYEMTTP